MMNKYALGTIVGASLLGLVKSKLGSNTRLKAEKYKVIEFAMQFLIYDFEEGDIEPQEKREIKDQVIQKYQSVNSDGIEVIQLIESRIERYDDHLDDTYLVVNIGFLKSFEGELDLWEVSDTIEQVLRRNGIDCGGVDIDENYEFVKTNVSFFDEKTGEWKPYSYPNPRVPKLRRR